MNFDSLFFLFFFFLVFYIFFIFLYFLVIKIFYFTFYIIAKMGLSDKYIYVGSYLEKSNAVFFYLFLFSIFIYLLFILICLCLFFCGEKIFFLFLSVFCG